MNDQQRELAPCPFCGGEPKTLERPDNIDGTEFVYGVMCYCGGYSATAHQLVRRKTLDQAKADAIAAWNTRALTQPQAQQAAAVPAGFKLVPIEPTQAMIEAYLACLGRFQSATTDWAAMLAAAPPAPVLPLSAWQPIEWAPKDGTNVLLTNGETVSQGVYEHHAPYVREIRDSDGRYIDQDEFDGFDGWIDFVGGMLPEPTHWQPLPAPPITAHGAGGE